MFCLEFTKSVVVYDCKPVHKQAAVKIFKNMRRQTVAVGNGLNDILMLQEAGAGILLAGENTSFEAGDFVTTHLRVLPKIINLNCRQWNHNMHMVIHNTFKFVVMQTIASLTYQFYSGFQGKPAYESSLHCMFLLASIPLSLISIL